MAQGDQKGKTRDSQMTIISIVSLLIVLLFIIEIYEIINDPHNFIVLGTLGVFILVAVYVETTLIHRLSVRKNKEQEEAYNNVYRSEKATYLLMRKYFDQMEQKIEAIDKKSGVPYEKLVATQKALTKVQINRNKENTNVLMHSNKAALIQGNRDIIAKQQEIITGLKDLETSIRNEILESANKMASLNMQQGIQETQISNKEDAQLQPVDMNDDVTIEDVQLSQQEDNSSVESDLDKLLMGMDNDLTENPIMPDVSEQDYVTAPDEEAPIIENAELNENSDIEPELEPLIEEPITDAFSIEPEPELEPFNPEPELQPFIDESELQSLNPEPELQPLIDEPTVEPLDIEPELQPLMDEPVIEPLDVEPELEPLMDEPAIEPLDIEPELQPLMDESTKEPLAAESTPAPLMDEPVVDSLDIEPELQPLMDEPAMAPLDIEPESQPLMDSQNLSELFQPQRNKEESIKKPFSRTELEPQPLTEESAIRKLAKPSPSMPDLSDPNHVMTSDEIAAMVANLGNEEKLPEPLMDDLDGMNVDTMLEDPTMDIKIDKPNESDPVHVMSAEEIAALIANTDSFSAPEQEEAKPAMPDLSNPGHIMSSDEIAALIANL